MPDKDLKSLTTGERRLYVAREDYKSSFGNTLKHYSQLLGVTEQCIFADRKHPDYKAELEKLEGGRIARIKAKSFKYVEIVIDQGLAAMENGFDNFGDLDAEIVNLLLADKRYDKDRAAKMVQWFLEKSGAVGNALDGDGVNNPLEEMRNAINENE